MPWVSVESVDDNPNLENGTSDSSSRDHNEAIDDALFAVGLGRHQALLFLYVGSCWMSDAMEVMLVAVLAPAIACEWGTSPAGQSLLASTVFIGMMLASSAWGIVADLAGRKVAFGAAAAVAASSGLVSSLSPSFAVLAVLRLLVGSGLVGVLPMYTLLEEWLPRASGHKGKWLVALQAWWSVGTVLEALLARWLLNTFGWRALLAASALPIACVLAALPWVPESPHYLAASGRLAAAHEALLAAAARNGTTERLRRLLQQQEHQHQQQQEGMHGEQQQQQQEASSPPPRLGPFREEQSCGQRNTGKTLDFNAYGTAAAAAAVPAPGVDAADLVATVNSSDATRGRPVSDSYLGRTVAGAGGDDIGTALEVQMEAGPDGVASDPASCVCGLSRTCQTCLRVVARAGAGLDPARVCRDPEGAARAEPTGWWANLVGLARIMLGPRFRSRTLRLAVTWFACALSYYGVVMLVPYAAAGGGLRRAHGGDGPTAGSSAGAAAGVAEDLGGGGSGSGALSCEPWPDGRPGSHLVLPPSAYWSMMAAASAELPSLAWAFVAVDRWSRRRTVAIGLGATAASLAPLIMALAGGRAGGGAAAIASAPPPPPPPPLPPPLAHRPGPWRRRHLQPAWLLAASTSWWLPLASVTLARLFVSGAFTLLYVLTPEQYPPRVHGSALGAANTLARVGALAAPFVAVALPQRGDLPEALALLAAACGVAAAAAAGLPDGGKGV